MLTKAALTLMVGFTSPSTHAMVLLLLQPVMVVGPNNPRQWKPKRPSDAFPDGREGVEEYEEVFDPDDPVFISRQREALHAFSLQQIADNAPPIPNAQNGTRGAVGKVGAFVPLKPPKKAPPALPDGLRPPDTCSTVPPTTCPVPPPAQPPAAVKPAAPKPAAPKPTLALRITPKPKANVSSQPNL